MDYSDYVKFIKRKYAYAVAYGILKIKPSNLETTEFCKILKDQLQKNTVDVNVCLHEKGKTISQNLALQKLSQILFEDVCLSENDLNQHELTSQFIQDFVDDTSANARLLSDNYPGFSVLSAVNNVKTKICAFNGPLSFDDITSQSSNEFIKSQSTQDTGYQPSQLTNFCSWSNDTDLSQLNTSLMILVGFLVEACTKNFDMSIVTYISNIYGRATDVLYNHNIFLSSFDCATDAIDNLLKEIIRKRYVRKMKEHTRSIFILLSFNKSALFIQHSLSYLTKELQLFMNKLSAYGASESMEYCEPDKIDEAFTIFHMFEGILKIKMENKFNKTFLSNLSYGSQAEQINSHEPRTVTQETNNNKLFLKLSENEEANTNDVRKRYLKLFNEIANECVDKYPLMTHWALTCINIDNSDC